jgi:BON domain
MDATGINDDYRSEEFARSTRYLQWIPGRGGLRSRNIQLSGVVASADDARAAQAIALNTRGVVGVKNQLTWH